MFKQNLELSSVFHPIPLRRHITAGRHAFSETYRKKVQKIFIHLLYNYYFILPLSLSFSFSSLLYKFPLSYLFSSPPIACKSLSSCNTHINSNDTIENLRSFCAIFLVDKEKNVGSAGLKQYFNPSVPEYLATQICHFSLSFPPRFGRSGRASPFCSTRFSPPFRFRAKSVHVGGREHVSLFLR